MALFSRCLLVAKPLISSCRCLSSWQTVALKYKEYGDPAKVLYKTTETLSADLQPGHVAVKFLASPINPMDINQMQGIYESKPPLPAVAGNEGVAEIIKVGSGVKNVQVGDHVIMAMDAFGTWRTHAILPEKSVVKVSAKLPLVQAATLAVNPFSAFRMLHDFAKLEEGDVVVQNGANSAVGQFVIQIAKHYKWRTVNIIRDRPNKAETVQFLADMGATHVITDGDFKNKEVIKHLPKAKLGLNCVGGTAVSDMTKLMDNHSVMVSYGAMSKKPMIIPTSALIFKEIIFCGFWMSRWNNSSSFEQRMEMADTVVDLMLKKALLPPVLQPVLLDDFQSAVERAQQEFSGRKQIFVMDEKILEQINQELK